MWPHRVSHWQSIARFERVSSRRPMGLDMSVADESRPVGNQDLTDVVTCHSEVFAVFRTALLASSRRDRAPKCRKPARALARTSDQRKSKLGFEMGRFFDAAQPCLLRARRNAFKALVTIVPMVRPLLLAYCRSRATVRGGSFRVTATVASGTSTGRSSWEACCR